MPRILSKLRIDEVSTVDRGAGEGVKIMLMKRAGDAGHVDRLADRLVAAGGGAFTRSDALRFLLPGDNKRGATTMRTDKAHQITEERQMTQFNVVKIAKSIVDDDGETPLTEHELTKMIADHAQLDRRPGESSGQAFARVFSADTDEGALFRKAVAIAKNLPMMITEPVQVGSAAAQEVDDPTDALAGLQKLAAEQHRRVPELTKEQAFAKVYSDPSNAALVAKERRQNRPGMISGQP